MVARLGAGVAILLIVGGLILPSAAAASTKSRPATAASSTTGDAGDLLSTAMVSVSTNGDPGDDSAYAAVTSTNGDIVAFSSAALNLSDQVPDPDQYNADNLFVRNTVTGVTTGVDTFPGDVVLATDTAFDLSGDGKWIVYGELEAVPGPQGYIDEVFLENLTTGQRTLISTLPPGDDDTNVQSVAISEDGSEVAFEGDSSDQLNGWHQSVWLYDTATGVLRDALQYVNGTANWFESLGGLSMSADGSTVAFSASNSNVKADPPAQWDAYTDPLMFVESTELGALPAEVLAPDGAVPNGGSIVIGHTLSANGRYLAFESMATNWTAEKPSTREFDVYEADLATGEFTRVTEGMNGGAVGGYIDGISNDGQSVVFDSLSGDLVQGDTNNVEDVFLWHRSSGQVQRVSVGQDGEQLSDASESGLLAGDGEHITFASGAGDIIVSETNEPRQQLFETTLSGASLPNLAASARVNTVALAWSNPRSNFTSVVVRGAQGRRAPACVSCGFAVYRGRGHKALSSHLRNGHVYMYAVFTKNAHGLVMSRKTAGARPHAQSLAVLGARRFGGHAGKGWGTRRPTTIVSTRGPIRRVSGIRWRAWGAQSSVGVGLARIVDSTGGYYRVHVRLRATTLGTCSAHGAPAYTKLFVRRPHRPGSKLGAWHPWHRGSAVATTIC